jgi:hypothetical protein
VSSVETTDFKQAIESGVPPSMGMNGLEGGRCRVSKWRKGRMTSSALSGSPTSIQRTPGVTAVPSVHNSSRWTASTGQM